MNAFKAIVVTSFQMVIHVFTNISLHIVRLVTAFLVFWGSFRLIGVVVVGVVGKPNLTASMVIVSILVSAVFALIWFYIIFPVIRLTLSERFAATDTHGSASFATTDQVSDVNTSAGFLLGRQFDVGKAKSQPPLKTKQHVLISAPTGSGKGTGLVIPNLLTYPGSMIVLDIKGENFHVTARRRRELGNKVYILDPFLVTGRTDRFNWLSFLDVASDDIVSDAAMLAEMLVFEEGESSDPYWNDSARDLIRGLIAHVASDRHFGEKTIAELRRVLTMPARELDEVLKTMSRSDSAFGLVARCANAFMGKAEKDRSGVLSGAIRHTSFLDDPRIARSVAGDDMDFRAFKREPCTLYIVIPPDRLAAYCRYVRAVFGIALSAMTREPTIPKVPVVFLLDEFPQLGHLAAIENGISLMRGYGVQFVTIIQDLSQLKGVYKKWQTFLSNSTTVFFGTTDFDTAKYLSSTLGELTVSVDSFSMALNDLNGDEGNVSTSQTGRALMTPDEIRTLRPDLAIVLTRGVPPVLVQRTPYYLDPELAGMYDKNPMQA